MNKVDKDFFPNFIQVMYLHIKYTYYIFFVIEIQKITIYEYGYK